MQLIKNIINAPHKREAARRAQDILIHLKPHTRVLDVGLGDAQVAYAIFAKGRRHGITIEGLDIADLRTAPIKLTLYNGLNFPFNDRSFDSVLLVYALHHCAHPLKILNEAYRVSNTNIVIMEDTPRNFLQRFVCRTHELKWKKLRQQNQPFVFNTRKEWLKIFQEAGLNVSYTKKIHNVWSLVHPVTRTLFVLEKV